MLVRFRVHALRDLLHLLVGEAVAHVFALLDPVERRLRDEQVPVFDDLRHVAVEEREQQGSDMRAVHVRVGHEKDLVVAKAGGVVVVSDAAAQRLHDGAHLFVGEHLVQPRLFDVQDLAAQRQDRLEIPVASLLGAAPRAVPLDDVQLALRGVPVRAVRELAGKVEVADRKSVV